MDWEIPLGLRYNLRGGEAMFTRRMLWVGCGVVVLGGLSMIPAAAAAGGSVPVQTLTYRVVDDQPAATQDVEVQQVGYRYGGFRSYGYGYGFRPRFGLSIGFGYRPSYYGYSYYRPYRSFYRAPYYGYSYYRPRYYGASLFRPRYYGYSYYRPSYYGYSYYRPSIYSYYRPLAYGGYYYGSSYPVVVPSFGGIRYHGSYGYGSACCN